MIRRRIFVASTYADLEEFRETAKFVIISLGSIPEMVGKLDGLEPSEIVDECTNKVAACDIFILVVGFRRGWAPPTNLYMEDNSSITALELEAAKKAKLPILVFMLNEGNLSKFEEEDEAKVWVYHFRNKMGASYPVVLCDTRDIDGFRYQLAVSLINLSKRI